MSSRSFLGHFHRFHGLKKEKKKKGPVFSNIPSELGRTISVIGTDCIFYVLKSMTHDSGSCNVTRVTNLRLIHYLTALPAAFGNSERYGYSTD